MTTPNFQDEKFSLPRARGSIGTQFCPPESVFPASAAHRLTLSNAPCSASLQAVNSRRCERVPGCPCAALLHSSRYWTVRLKCFLYFYVLFV